MASRRRAAVAGAAHFPSGLAGSVFPGAQHAARARHAAENGSTPPSRGSTTARRLRVVGDCRAPASGAQRHRRKMLMQPIASTAWSTMCCGRPCARPGVTVFPDVGTIPGLAGLDAALTAGAGSRIIAIEPKLRLLNRLSFNLRQAQAAGRISDITRHPHPRCRR